MTSATLAAPVPVLAAIDGVCIGGALEFAASCDLRLATDRARFGTPEVGIGLTYTNAGSHFLPSTMGETAARELLLTGALRDVAWAERHRFVNEVVPRRRASTSASPRGPPGSTTSRARPSRARRRCSTTASATCSARRWSARSARASSCSTGPTRRRRSQAFARRR